MNAFFQNLASFIREALSTVKETETGTAKVFLCTTEVHYADNRNNDLRYYNSNKRKIYIEKEVKIYRKFFLFRRNKCFTKKGHRFLEDKNLRLILKLYRESRDQHQIFADYSYVIPGTKDVKKYKLLFDRITVNINEITNENRCNN